MGRFMDSNLDPRTSVLRAIGVNAAINFSPALSAPKYGGAHPRFVGSWVAGWYSPVTPGQGTQPPESSYIRRTPTRGPLRPPSNLLTTRRRAEHGSTVRLLCNSFRLRGTDHRSKFAGRPAQKRLARDLFVDQIKRPIHISAMNRGESPTPAPCDGTNGATFRISCYYS